MCFSKAILTPSLIPIDLEHFRQLNAVYFCSITFNTSILRQHILKTLLLHLNQVFFRNVNSTFVMVKQPKLVIFAFALHQAISSHKQMDGNKTKLVSEDQVDFSG